MHPYDAYLVRLWSTQRGGVPGCRVALQNVSTGERHHFADLESLLAFWQGRMASPELGASDSDPDGVGSEV
jgi:hypothetical protein